MFHVLFWFAFGIPLHVLHLLPCPKVIISVFRALESVHLTDAPKGISSVFSLGGAATVRVVRESVP